MAIVGSVFVALSVVTHLIFFAMESVLWSSPTVWRRFGLDSQRDADVVRPMAYSHGFYNLFLAAGATVGLVLYWTTLHHVGFGLIFFTGACMILAAVVLLATDRRLWRASLLQGLPPLIGLLLFAIGQAG